MSDNSVGMAVFVGKRIHVDFVQEVGWRRPIKIRVDKKVYSVQEVLSRHEEHMMKDAWWQRRHRVNYSLRLANGSEVEIYWNRGARGEGDEWVLLKETRSKRKK